MVRSAITRSLTKPRTRPVGAMRSPVRTVSLLARTLRAKQWTKNVLVFAAPAAAGVLGEGDVLRRSVIAFVSFSLLASAFYIFNDVRDVDADRKHPRKRYRPIAAREIATSTAVALAVLVLTGAAVLAALLPAEYAAVMIGYGANTVLYIAFGKHVPTLDLLQVALGFVLRSVAGAVATDVEMSPWFVGVAMFGSLLMVAGKRSSEVRSLGSSGETRVVLKTYTSEYLGQVATIAAGGTLLTYALWALGDAPALGSPWAIASFGPVSYAVLRYVHLSDAGLAEEPELVVVRERGLLVAGAVWLVLAALGVYA